MIYQTYEEAITEVLDILNHTQIEDVKKIPPEFIQYLIQNSSKTYKPKLDHTKNLKDMNLQPKTRALLAFIYREYFCNESQRKDYDKKLLADDLEHQKELKEKYDLDELFKNKKIPEIKSKEIMPANNKKEKSFSKVLSKILKLFKR